MIAVWDDTDQWHQEAKAAYEILLNQGIRRSECAIVAGSLASERTINENRSQPKESRHARALTGATACGQKPNLRTIEAAAPAR
ncbi:MAG: hypothetical protein ACREJM_02140 [Candidatus Saccharimonadales bacterium]